MAEVNPALRHHLKQLYNLDLPETIDLRSTTLTAFHEQLKARIQASEPGVSLTLTEKPRIQLFHEKAKQRVDQYRRRMARNGRRITAAKVDYSYDKTDFRPLGLQVFQKKIVPAPLPLRDLAGAPPLPRQLNMVAETERKTFSIVEDLLGNPYSWEFDLCSLTLANFNYRIPDRQLALRDSGETCIESPQEAATLVPQLLSRPISFIHCKAMPYENRRNAGEAASIAQIVRELLSRDTKLSIGIAAFSEAQQGQIESALDSLAQSDPAFASLLEAEYIREEDDQFCGLFVKNLENIQGDERDIILMSVCYGRDPNGRILMNFGPINQRGGEKRLNVIFSRARQHMVLLSSLRHSDITNDYNDGANALKNFLHYAESLSRGDVALARQVLDGLNPLKRQVLSLEQSSACRGLEAMNRILNGEKLVRRESKDSYGTQEGVPIREEVVSRHGKIAITRNSYGSQFSANPTLGSSTSNVIETAKNFTGDAAALNEVREKVTASRPVGTSGPPRGFARVKLEQ